MTAPTDVVNQLPPGAHIHLLGIGGAGMSAIAWVLLGAGYHVSGSDLHRNAVTEALAEAGVTVYQGHAAENMAGAALLVISSAIPAENPERQAAVAAGIPVLKRAAFLGQLMAERHGIAIAGSHGKTTTTGMVAQILIAAGADPSVIVGGVLPLLSAGGRAGQGACFVVEADEYDHMFLGLRPRTAVVTNVEHDHPDMFPTAEAYRTAFAHFVSQLPAGGTLICCADDGGARALLAAAPAGLTRVSYGLTQALDGIDDHWQATDLRPNQLGGTDFVVLRGSTMIGLFRLRVPGEYNVRNALAALAATLPLDIQPGSAREALMAFGGVGRRFQVTGQVGDVVVIDDYAHHPTEIGVTLAAARQRYPGRRIWAVWQPHTYSRTRLLRDAFAGCFADADRVIALDIFRSREPEDSAMSSADVVARMDHPYARHIGERRAAADYVLERVLPGDVVITLGAGDGNAVGEWIVAELARRRPGGSLPAGGPQ